MPQVRSLIDAYIDANVILACAFVFWWLVLRLLRQTSLKQDFSLQLRLSEGFLLAVVISPIFAIGFTKLLGAISPGQTVNAADLVLAQFLNGRLDMDAARFETLLNFRQNLVLHLTYFDGALAQGLLAVVATCATYFCGRAVRDYVRLRRVLRQSHMWRRSGSVDIHLSDTVRIPFSAAGLRRRRIVLPTALLADPKALRIVLAHELQHMRRFDTEWEVFLSLLKPFFFWNPAFLIWKREIEVLRELNCDQAVLKRSGIQPRDYAECLLAMCRTRLDDGARRSQLAPVVPFLDVTLGATGRRNFRTLRQRILQITSPPATRLGSRIHFWMPLLAAALFVGFVAATIQRPGDWSQDRLMLSTIVNLERLEALNEVTLRSW